MDNFTIDYILDYYSRFMTLQEAAAMKHYITSSNFREKLSNDEANVNRNSLIERGWLSAKPEILELLKDGYMHFRRNTAERILKEHRNEVIFNLCPKCGKLARTPQAKQCRFCGYSWHNIIS